MKVEFCVVITELNARHIDYNDQLWALKVKLCEKFGGLTADITAREGYWLNGEGILEKDLVLKYEVLSQSTSEIKLDVILDIAREIKLLTFQKSQLVTVDNLPYFV